MTITWEVKAELKLRYAAEYESSSLDDLLASKLPCDNHRTILQGKELEHWLSVLSSIVNGRELSA
jgi:hypothetical protein